MSRFHCLTLLLLLVPAFLPSVFLSSTLGQSREEVPEKRIIALIEELRHWRRGKGREAYQALLKIGKPAVPYLSKAMDDRFSKSVRELCASLLQAKMHSLRMRDGVKGWGQVDP